MSMKFLPQSAVTLFLFASPVLGQPGLTEVIPNYPKHEAELYRKYLTNLKVRVEQKGYDSVGRTGKFEGVAERTILMGDRKLRINSSVVRGGNSKKLLSGAMYDFDEMYMLDGTDAGKYRIEGQRYDSMHSHYIEEELSNAGVTIPLTAGGISRVRDHDDTERVFQRTQGRALTQYTAPSKATHEGRNAAMIEGKLGEQTYRLYFDPDNSYAYLGHEVSQVMDVKTRKYVNVKLVGSLTYEPSDLGYPVPKKYVSYYVNPDGTKVPRSEITFLEYSRYTPQPDDFDLEKQFGVKPLPRSAKAGPSKIGPGGGQPYRSGWGIWLWVGAGVLAVATAGVFVIARKQRKAN
jgi:hypothetical protein